MTRPALNVLEGFSTRSQANGLLEYSCNTCSKARGGPKWFKSKNNMKKHLDSIDHVKSIDDLKELDDNQAAMAYEAAQEAEPRDAIEDVGMPVSRPHLRRPALSVCGNSNTEEVHGFMDDVLFSAGQEVEDVFMMEDEPVPTAFYSDEEDDDMAEYLNDALAGATENLRSMNQTNTLSEALFPPTSSKYFPYKSKTMFLLDWLDNLPRLPMSRAHMRAFIFAMREAGVDDVPSLETLRRYQKALRGQIAVPTNRKKSTRNNIFYVNDIAAQVAHDFANPLVRPFIRLYPEKTDGVVNEVWQASKWMNELKSDQLTPMVIGIKGQHFYVNELTYTNSKEFVIPIKWYTNREELYGECWTVARSNGVFSVDRTTIVDVPVSELRFSFPALQAKLSGNPLQFRDTDTDLRTKMPNPWREKAKGKPVYCIQLRIWQDDVSGNVSKQWNKHWMYCMTLAGIPKKLLAQEYFTRYISCSPHASVLEQASALSDAISASQEGIVAFDVLREEEAMLSINVLYNSSDNPMTCECVSHIGLQGNYFCPRCKVGGDKEFKTSDEGFRTLFHVNETLRTVNETVAEVIKQYERGIKGENLTELQRESGVKDTEIMYWIERAKENSNGTSVESSDEERIRSEAYEKMNPFLKMMGFNAHLDCPVEPLHTVLLGVIKYAWAMTCKQIEESKNLLVFQARLQSINIDGLSIDPIRAEYLVQYRNSLIGRQFKSIVQIVAFTLHGLVDDQYRDMWAAAGNMVSLIWFPEIENITEYSISLQSSIDTFLDRLAIIDPSKILWKSKCHILTHLVEDVKRFGPPIVLSTETFESYNAVFRHRSVLSNHHAPSKDIGMRIANMDRFKHIASGGRWKSKGDWVSPGQDIIRFFRSNDILHSHLGWTDPRTAIVGSVRKPGKKVQTEVGWDDTLGPQSIPLYAQAPEDHSTFVHCISCVCMTSDVVRIGSFVILGDQVPGQDFDYNYSVGQVAQILEKRSQGVSSSEVLVILKKFATGGQHAHLKLPTLHSPLEPTYILAHVMNIKHVLNVQHDCERSGCKIAKEQVVVQEREKTQNTIWVVKHSDDGRFVVNIHSLHLPHVTRKMFKSELYSVPGIEDRMALHKDLASRVRTKLKIAAEKAKEKAAKRKAMKAHLNQEADLPKKKQRTTSKAGPSHAQLQSLRTVEQQLDAETGNAETGNEFDLDPDDYPSDNDVPDVNFNEIDLVNIAASYDSFNGGRTYTFMPQYFQQS